MLSNDTNGAGENRNRMSVDMLCLMIFAGSVFTFIAALATAGLEYQNNSTDDTKRMFDTVAIGAGAVPALELLAFFIYKFTRWLQSCHDVDHSVDNEHYQAIGYAS